MSGKRTAQNKPKNLSNVSHPIRNASDDQRGVVVAAIEVAPRGAAMMSLGIFNKDEPPKGFRLDAYPELEPSLIKAEATTYAAFTGGFHYLLQVANFSNTILWVEIRELV